MLEEPETFAPMGCSGIFWREGAVFAHGVDLPRAKPTEYQEAFYAAGNPRPAYAFPNEAKGGKT